MYSLTRSARSTGPLVVLVAFSVIFAATWSHDQPDPRPLLADASRREPTMIGDPAPPAWVADVRPLRKSPSNPKLESGIETGLRCVTGVWKSRNGLLRAGTAGSQLGARVLVTGPKRSCFTDGAAFLCGTIHEAEKDDAPRTAGTEDQSQWALE